MREKKNEEADVLKNRVVEINKELEQIENEEAELTPELKKKMSLVLPKRTARARRT